MAIKIIIIFNISDLEIEDHNLIGYTTHLSDIESKIAQII